MKAPRLLVAAFALFSVSTTAAQEGYERLSGEEIRSEITGRDITDDFHWWKYFREDGAIVAIDLGRETVGRWFIESDRLCMAEDTAAKTDCLQVWVRRDEVLLRLDDQNVRLIGFVRRHEGS